MTSTKETYDYLVESHGIKTDVCKYCYNRDVEVFQDNWEGCYICWCNECEPKISPPPE